jgi:hypothetical protein
MRSLAQSYLFAYFLIAQIVGLTQFYPYAHLHHVHDEDGSRVVLSVHPISISDEIGEIPVGDEHHHDIDHLTLDCHFCQRLLKQLQQQADCVVPTFGENESTETVVEYIRALRPQLLSASQSVAPPKFRGPPKHS